MCEYGLKLEPGERGTKIAKGWESFSEGRLCGLLVVFIGRLP